MLHLLGSPLSDFDYNLSVMYGKKSIKAGYGKINNYFYSFAYVHPGGEISFPAHVDDENVPRVRLFKALEMIEDLAPDVVLSHMFCLQAPAYKGMLELLDIPHIGPDAMTMANVLNKTVSRAILLSAGLPVPKGVVVDTATDLDTLDSLDLDFPVVVKPTTCENSIGITLVKERAELVSAVNVALSYSPQCIIDQFIPGREARISVIESSDGNIIPLPAFEYTQINCNDIRKFEDKLDCSQKQEIGLAKSGAAVRYLTQDQDSKLIQKLERIAIQSHIAISCRDFSQLDVRISEDGEVYILEVNVFCSLSPSSVVNRMYKQLGHGHTDADLMNIMVENALSRSGLSKKGTSVLDICSL